MCREWKEEIFVIVGITIVACPRQGGGRRVTGFIHLGSKSYITY